MRVLKFRSVKELLEYLDSEISSTRSMVEELRARVQVLRGKLEVISRVESVLKELGLSYVSGSRECV